MSRLEALKRKPFVSKEDVLNATRNGLEIYNKYVHLKERGGRYIGLCPFHDERTGSFQVFGDRNSYKCFGCGAGGIDAIKFLQEKEGLSFKDAVELGSKMFHVEPSSQPLVKRPPASANRPMEIDFVDMPFNDQHRTYWNQYLLPESYLRKKNVFAVQTWAINGKIQPIGKDEVVFAYFAEDIDKVKILRIGPNVEKKDKWRNTVPNETYLWDLPKEKVEELWIMKARKDSFCMEYHFGKTVTALQNEDPTLFLEHCYDRVEPLADRKIVCLGSDDHGWHSSFLITHLTDWQYFNSPNYMLQYGVQDIADVIAEFGLDIIEQDLKRKGYL